MSEKQSIESVVEALPDLVGGKVEGPPWAEAEKIYGRILEGGEASIRALIGLLHAVDDGRDYKPRYALHGLGVYVCREGMADRHAMLVDVLCQELENEHPGGVKAFLIRQLQAVGDGRAVSTLKAFLSDAALADPAAQALVAIGDGALDALQESLVRAEGSQRLAIVHALGAVPDKDSDTLDALVSVTEDADREVRLAAIRALAAAGEPRVGDAALKAAQAEGWERLQGVDACLALAEELERAGQSAEAQRLYQRLLESRRDATEHYLKERIRERL